MATYSDLDTISNNANFQSRVQYAMEVAATNVYAEDPATVGHNARINYAKLVFAGTYSLQTVSLMVLTNAAIAAEANILIVPGFAIPDTDIQFAVNSLWNDFAGA